MASASKESQVSLSKQERRFVEAIDRILAGKPRHAELQPAALAKARRKLTLTKTSVSLEAGYARSYLYKNEATMRRVIERLDEVTNPRRPVASARDLIAKLRLANAELRQQRNLAIDMGRRWIQEGLKLREAVELKDRTISRLEKELRKQGRSVIDFTARRTAVDTD